VVRDTSRRGVTTVRDGSRHQLTSKLTRARSCLSPLNERPRFRSLQPSLSLFLPTTNEAYSEDDDWNMDQVRIVAVSEAQTGLVTLIHGCVRALISVNAVPHPLQPSVPITFK
jgi:hypothetical protein